MFTLWQRWRRLSAFSNFCSLTLQSSLCLWTPFVVTKPLCRWLPSGHPTNMSFPSGTAHHNPVPYGISVTSTRKWQSFFFPWHNEVPICFWPICTSAGGSLSPRLCPVADWDRSGATVLRVWSRWGSACHRRSGTHTVCQPFCGWCSCRSNTCKNTSLFQKRTSFCIQHYKENTKEETSAQATFFVLCFFFVPKTFSANAFRVFSWHSIFKLHKGRTLTLDWASRSSSWVCFCAGPTVSPPRQGLWAWTPTRLPTTR